MSGRSNGLVRRIERTVVVDQTECLASLAGERFAGGVVLYTGDHVVPFGPKLRAVPLSALWSNAPPRT